MNPAVANLTLFLVCLMEVRATRPKWQPWQHWLSAFLLTFITVWFL